ncbi:MAG: DUF1573 domain-containing protein [Armatimonadetes bacterium]|nr:DUF1573 domain-containing protein [Armatimonadota bacterium]
MLVMLALSTTRAAVASVDARRCGSDAVFALARLLGHEVSAAAQSELLTTHPTQETLLECRRLAEALGLPLKGVRATVSEVLGFQQPCLIHLEPDHFAILLESTPDQARILSQERLTIMSREAFAARFSGAALVVTSTRAAGPRCQPLMVHKKVENAVRGQRIESVFAIRNEGPQPLTLNVVGRSCDCLSVEPSSQVVNPGEVGKIRLTFVADSGGQVVSVTIESNDTSKPRLILSSSTEVARDWQIVPAGLSATLAADSSIDMILTVVTPNNGKLEIVAPVPEFAEVISVAQENGVWRWRIRLHAGDTAGRQDSQLHLVCREPDQREISVPVGVTTRSRYEVTPASVRWLHASPLAESTARVIIRRLDHGGEFRVLPVTVDDPDLVAVAGPVQDGPSEWHFEVALRVKPVGAMRTTRLRVIAEDNAGSESIVIPLVAMPAADD